MRCTHPRSVGFKADGKTISWSPRTHSKEYALFQLPCGQCLECRLDYGRQWALRCVHEAKMYKNNCFLTLTYDDDHLKSPKLIYEDFQKFMKKLRKVQDAPIGVFVTGEYGEKNKRPHWHCILFNYRPSDGVLSHSSDRGDKLFTSKTIDRIWGYGRHDFGEVTFQSAGYCARYAAKKLIHGKDGEHEFEPISKKSSKHAIGKRWLEQNFLDIVNTGTCRLDDGTPVAVPRYYEKWLKEHQPNHWLRYVTNAKAHRCAQAAEKAEKINQEYLQNLWSRAPHKPNPLTPNQIRAYLTKAKFKMLQDNLKL